MDAFRSFDAQTLAAQYIGNPDGHDLWLATAIEDQTKRSLLIMAGRPVTSCTL